MFHTWLILTQDNVYAANLAGAIFEDAIFLGYYINKEDDRLGVRSDIKI